MGWNEALYTWPREQGEKVRGKLEDWASNRVEEDTALYRFTQADDEAERTKIFLEDIYFDFLNTGAEPEPRDDAPYRTDIMPTVEDYTGLEHPDEFDLVEYGDGAQLIYDKVTDMFNQFNLYERAADHDLEASALLRVPALPFILWRRRAMLRYMADMVNGVYDVGRVHEGDAPILPEDNEIGVVPSNIRRGADVFNVDTEVMTRFTLVHEGVHATQHETYPGIQERRAELVNGLLDADTSLVGNVFNRDERSQVKDEIQAVMSAVEGHADFWTRKIFEEEYNREMESVRSRTEKWMHRLKERVYGIHTKRQQYEKGREFCDTLYEKGGEELVHTALEELPVSMEEIETPEKWIRRVA